MYHEVLDDSATVSWTSPEPEPGPGDTRVVDLAGAYVVPGLIDLHVHHPPRFAPGDRELFDAHRRRQARLVELQRLYRLQLDNLMRSVRELRAEESTEPRLLEQARRSALAAVRALDPTGAKKASLQPCCVAFAGK